MKEVDFGLYLIHIAESLRNVEALPEYQSAAAVRG